MTDPVLDRRELEAGVDEMSCSEPRTELEFCTLRLNELPLDAAESGCSDIGDPDLEDRGETDEEASDVGCV